MQKEEWYVRSVAGSVYGPATREELVEWAKEGRIEPSSFVSSDRKTWTPAQLMAELEMKWVVEAELGKFFGPFNREVVIRLSSSNAIPKGAKIYRSHDFPIAEDAPPVIVEKEVRIEVPVEKIVEKIVEVPVEKIVEKIVEVEKVIEVEPPARTEIIEPEVVSAVAKQPPQPLLQGIFKGIDRAHMQALEAAAQREITAAKSKHSGFGIFSRRG